MEHKNPRTVIDDQNLTLQPPWGLCLKAAGRLRGGTPNRLSQGRVATAGTESPQKVNCHKNNGIWKCVFHAAEGGGVAEDIGRGTSCLVLSQSSLERRFFSPHAVTQLRQVAWDPAGGAWVSGAHETGAGGWHFTIVPPSAKTQKREQLALVRVLLL